MERPEDPSLKIVLDGFADMIAKTVSSDERDRFTKVAKIAKLADAALKMSSTRAADFNEVNLNEYGDNGMYGQNIGAIRLAGGDQNELMRTAIDTMLPALSGLGKKADAEVKNAEAQMRKAQAEELETLLKIRKTDITDLFWFEARIEAIKKEMTYVEPVAAAVVPPLLLRGHQTRNVGEDGDDALLGAADADRAQGA